MKNPILVSILLISILLNGAGIVFFILFMGERGHSKNLRRQKDVLARNFDVASSGNKIALAVSAGEMQIRTFASHLDGQMDFYQFQAPQFLPNTLDYTLVVYLHGMGSTYLEPFVAAPNANISVAEAFSRDFPRAGLLSCSYRKEASWGSDAALADIVQNIRAVMQEYPFKRVVLMGTSMGACVSLNLATALPEDIKSKLTGVVAMEPAGDLAALYKSTENKLIRPALIMAFGGAPDQTPLNYSKKNFLTNITDLPHSARVYILSQKSDRTIPPELQKAIIDVLNQRGIANHFDELDGDHMAPDPTVYERGLRYVLGETI